MQHPKVVVFGVFDLLHPGHVFFLEQASKYGELHVIVSLDAIVRMLKNKTPNQDENVRLQQVQELPYVKKAYLCDIELGSYQILRHINPDIICIGHDQHFLCQHLQEKMKDPSFPQAKIVHIEAFHAELYSTTILSNKSI
jgi:FAD synthetase